LGWLFVAVLLSFYPRLVPFFSLYSFFFTTGYLLDFLFSGLTHDVIIPLLNIPSFYSALDIGVLINCVLSKDHLVVDPNMSLCQDGGCFCVGQPQYEGYCSLVHWQSSSQKNQTSSRSRSLLRGSRGSRNSRALKTAVKQPDLLVSPVLTASTFPPQHVRVSPRNLSSPPVPFNALKSASPPARSYTTTTKPLASPLSSADYKYNGTTRPLSVGASKNKHHDGGNTRASRIRASTDKPKTSKTNLPNQEETQPIQSSATAPTNTTGSLLPPSPSPPPSQRPRHKYTLSRSSSVNERPPNYANKKASKNLSLKQNKEAVTSTGFVEYNVKQQQRMGLTSEAVLRLDVSLQLLSVFKARTKQAKKAGMQNSKQYSCDSISEMTCIGDCKLVILIADGSHNGKGTKKEFEFHSTIKRTEFITTMNETHRSLVKQHRSLRTARVLGIVGLAKNKFKASVNRGKQGSRATSNNNGSSAINNDDTMAEEGSSTLQYRSSCEIAQCRKPDEHEYNENDVNRRDSFNRSHRRNGSMSRRAIKEAALSRSNLLCGEEYLLSVDHVLVMGQQHRAEASFASNKIKKEGKGKKKNSYGTGSRGQMVVTNYRVMFDDYNSANRVDYMIPVATISSLSVNKKMGKGKDFFWVSYSE
jgi:hypothetical protein